MYIQLHTKPGMVLLQLTAGSAWPCKWVAFCDCRDNSSVLSNRCRTSAYSPQGIFLLPDVCSVQFLPILLMRLAILQFLSQMEPEGVSHSSGEFALWLPRSK